jgi:hypothetical protein
MIQKIKERNFYIKDEKIKELIRINKIEHLKFNIVNDDEAYLSAEFPNYDDILSFNKNWIKINWGRGNASVRTPSFLKDFIGKEVDVYQDKIFGDAYELFRIKPIGFNLTKNLKVKKKRVSINVPYFSKAGQCIIPKKYIQDKNLCNIITSKISFDRMDVSLVSRGFVFARIVEGANSYGLTYSLSKCSNGVRTRKLGSVLNIIFSNGKNIHNFQFLKTVYDNENHYDLMVFKEAEINGS